ncbi:MAG: prefoldin subunit beta [Candidatus Pacearchaeota archaeon]
MKEKKDLEELQIYEQNLQSLLLQKQLFQAELNEVEKAFEELNKLKEDSAFKIIGGIMIKKNVDELKKELNERKDLLELRIKNLEKQEKIFKSKIDEIREEILKNLKKNE